MTDEPQLQRRSLLLFTLFGVWLAIAGIRTWQIAVWQRNDFLKAGENVARFVGNIPPQRGKIIDRNGVALAWNERFYDLVADLEEGESYTDFERQEILRRFPKANWRLKTLKTGLSPAEVMDLEKLISGGVRVKIVPRNERIMINSPELRLKLQELDRKYDATLRGEPGKFQVLLDHYHQWIPSTWELLSPPVPGLDLQLNAPLSELERRL